MDDDDMWGNYQQLSTDRISEVQNVNWTLPDFNIHNWPSSYSPYIGIDFI